MINRRKFVQTAMAGSASMLIAQDVFSGNYSAGRLKLELGICTGVDNSGLVKKKWIRFFGRNCW